MADTPHPWVRRPGETVRAYGAFVAYRDLGVKRSLAEACHRYYSGDSPVRNIRQLERWSSMFRWQDRVAAWDEEQDRKAQGVMARAKETMARRHAAAAGQLLDKAIDRLGQIGPEALTTRDLLRYICEAAKLERLALGQATVIVGGDINVGRSNLFDRIERLAADLAEHGVGSGDVHGNGIPEHLDPPRADPPPGGGPPAV